MPFLKFETIVAMGHTYCYGSSEMFSVHWQQAGLRLGFFISFRVICVLPFTVVTKGDLGISFAVKLLFKERHCHFL